MTITHPAITFNGKLMNRTKTEKIIIHHAAAFKCGAREINDWHKNNGWAGIGYHFVVRKDGTVEAGRPHKAVGAHAIGENNKSIGICCEGDFNKERMGAVQLSALQQLVDHITNMYGKDLPVFVHKDVNNTDCPGKYFPTDKVKRWKENLDMTPEEVKKIVKTMTTTMVYNNIAQLPEWGKKPVKWALSKGLLQGPKENDFSIDTNMLRMIVFLYRYENLNKV